MSTKRRSTNKSPGGHFRGHGTTEHNKDTGKEPRSHREPNRTPADKPASNARPTKRAVNTPGV